MVLWEHLPVDGLGVEYRQWSEVGSSPFLNAVDANYIKSLLGTKLEGYFSFADTTHTPTACTLAFQAKGDYDEELGFGVFKVYLYDGASWQLAGTISITQTTYKEYLLDVSTILSTQAKVNAAKMYLHSTVYGLEYCYVDRARLIVYYEEAVALASKRLLVGVGI